MNVRFIQEFLFMSGLLKKHLFDSVFDFTFVQFSISYVYTFINYALQPQIASACYESLRTNQNFLICQFFRKSSVIYLLFSRFAQKA